jgi:hypothetical protein
LYDDNLVEGRINLIVVVHVALLIVNTLALTPCSTYKWPW